MTPMSSLVERFGDLQQWLFERAVEPLMFALGQGHLLENGYDATGWLLVGLLQIAVMVVGFALLERWRPVETVADRAAVRVDILYTLIHRLGLVRVVLFFTLDPVWDTVVGDLRVWGLPTFHVDAIWPGVTDIAWVSFLLYLVLFDGVDYALHRGQHAFGWWWQLHSLHHSQRHMTLWSDNRGHLLDDVIRDSALVFVALLIGIPPGQFVAVVAATQLIESLSHANVRLSFGWLEPVLVSPRFHRLHHSIGIGHESGERGSLGGHNFAALFPLWDLLFRSARFDDRYDATGVRDQLPEEGGRDYGQGFWSQQWLGLKRLVRKA
jgi:sterol desaturase/sphingolipid hydroxylase (fatty acid hydroxylase superfamily)